MFELLILVLLVTASLLFGNGFVTALEDLYQMASEKFNSPRLRREINTPADSEQMDDD